MQRTVFVLTHIRYDRLIVWFECVALAVLFSMYMYFLVASIIDVVLHKETLVSIQETESSIGQLESQYFARLDTLTPDILPAYGLVAEAPSAYVTVTSPADRLTKRD